MGFNMAMLNVFMLALCLFSGTLASNEFNEKTTCKNLKHQESFDFGRFSGLWYPIGLFDRFGNFPVKECMGFKFNSYKNGDKLILQKKIYVGNRKTNQAELVEENYSTAIPGDQAYFKNETSLNGPFFERCILSTDYDKYAVVSISNEENGNWDHLVAMLVKDRSLARDDPIFQNAYDTAVRIIGTESAKTYQKMSHPENCPEIPTA